MNLQMCANHDIISASSTYLLWARSEDESGGCGERQRRLVIMEGISRSTRNV